LFISDKLCNFASEYAIESIKKEIMKKFFTIMLMAVAIAMPSKAQTKFGIQAGVNLTNISDFSFSQSGVENAIKNKAGFFVGPTVKFTFPIVGLGIDASALYDQREGKIESNGESKSLKSQSIQIPINVRYGFGLGSLAEIFAFAGPQFGFNIGSKTKELVDDVAQWTLKSSNFSANVGIGATFINHIQLKINYNIAFGKTGEVEVKKVGEKVWETVTGAKENAWQISAAYIF
jgi:hypothetical protein